MRTPRMLAVAGALTALLLGPATAATAATEAEYAAALEAVADGSYTSADLALIRSDPALAAQVPDPTRPLEVSVESSPGTKAKPKSTAEASLAESTTTLAATVYCGAWARIKYTQRSLTGSVIYTYATYTQYCRDGAKVLRWEARYDYLAASSSVVYWREQVVNQYAGLGTYTAWSHFQRHIEYCVVKYGCYANTYPWIKTTVRANGTYSYSGSAA